MRRYVILGVVIAALVGGWALRQVLPWAKIIPPSVVPEPVVMLGGFAVTNSLLITVFVDILLILLVLGATSRLSLVPGGLQNAVEMVIEAVHNLVSQTTGGDQKRTRWFFPFVLSFLLLILPANFLGLVPGFGPVGILHYEDESQSPPQGVVALVDLPKEWFHIPHEAHVPARHEEPGAPHKDTAEFVPFFRAPSSDLNVTLAFALISWTMTQFYGGLHLGPLGYLSKYIVLGKIGQGFGALFSGRAKAAASLIGFGLIDFLVGIIEAISEVAKIISFTFRLFGNIFAGEVLLVVMAFLFPLLPLPFYGLEILVALIQAFVFAILTLMFMTQATTAPHGAEEHH